MKKGNNSMLELGLFFMSILFTGLSAWLLFDKSHEVNQKFEEIQDNMVTLEDANDINNRLYALEQKIDNPKTVNLVMKEPVKVMYKPIKPLVPVQAKPLPPIPGDIPKLKGQIKKLSQ